LQRELFCGEVVIALWGLLERVLCAPHARCEDAVEILYLEAAFAKKYNKTSKHEKHYNKFIIMNAIVI